MISFLYSSRLLFLKVRWINLRQQNATMLSRNALFYDLILLHQLYRIGIITMRNLIFTDISPLTKTVNNLVNPVLCPEGLQLKIVSEQNYVGKQTIFTLEDSHSNFPNCFQNHTHK